MIAIFGPTGVGKTAVALEIAERLRERGEHPLAISADALQVYRGLEVLTGAATPEEQGWPLVFLNSDAATFITGLNLIIDGGFVAGMMTGKIDLDAILSQMAEAQS